MRRATAAALLALIAVSCGEAPDEAAGPSTERDRPIPATPASAPWFEECAEERGLVFRHVSGHRERFLLPEIMCGGAALFDMDGDEDLDAYLVQAGGLEVPESARPVNRLFRNLGEGRFEDATAGSGAGDRGYGMGVTAGDYDGDGDVDLYVTNVGANVLLRNDGDGRFTDVTLDAGVGHPGWGASCAFLDHDGDGDLDLYVANYLAWSPDAELECFDARGDPDYCSPGNFDSPQPDVLYRNEGDGTFTDVSVAAGLHSAVGTGLGVLPADFDGDGRTDVFVANDGMPDHLWINRGDGTFAESALRLGCAVDMDGVPKAGMGVDAADLDGDGDRELLVMNLRGQSDSLYRNEGGWFSEITVTSGLRAASRAFTRFGVGFHDFDCDGLLDLYQANGKVTRAGPPHAADPFAEPNLLFRGVGALRFAAAEPEGGTAAPLVATTRGAAFGDVDGDGGVDVLLVNRDGPAHLLRNVVPERGAWISVRAVRSGSDALGAELEIATRDGSRVRDVCVASSYCSSSDPRVLVGLGEARDVPRVTVRWPDGSTEAFGPFPGGARVVVRASAGR